MRLQQSGSIKNNKGLQYWPDNSFSILSLTQTMVALHCLLKGLTMVTGHGRDSEKGLFPPLLLPNNYEFALLI